jgi:hypothetical protein
MAGTLVVSTLSDGTYSTSATNPILGSFKAWCNWNGITSTILASYNISSMTRNATGDYTFTFTNAMTDANYASVFGCNGNGSAQNVQLANYATTYSTAPNTRTATQFRVACGATNSATWIDTPSNSMGIIR